MVCHSLLQWTTFCHNSLLWPVHLGWPCTAWLMASLSYQAPSPWQGRDHSSQFPRRVVPIPKKGSARECVSHWIIALISHASKVMLKILHVRLRPYANQELPGVQTGFRKARGTRDQVANIHSIIEKPREFQKNIYLCFVNYTKAFVWIITNWKTLRVGNTRPSYLSPEKPVFGSRSNS